MAKRATKTKETTQVQAQPENATDKAIAAARELDKEMSTSAKIRALSAQGFERGDISRALSEVLNKNIRYQHVRNVLITPLKTKTAE